MKIKFAFLLPNFFTALSVFFGIMSIIASKQGKYEKAFIYIVLSLIADGLDGRVAGATPNATISASESNSTPNLLVVCVSLAILPSKPSNISERKINQADFSKSPLIAAVIDITAVKIDAAVKRFGSR